MNLSAGARQRTVEAFVAQIDEAARSACHSYLASVPTSLGGRDFCEKASVNHVVHRQVNRTHSSAPVVAQHTSTAHHAHRRANGARHPEPVSVLIHTV
jgi:hypothetical protein